MELSRGVVRKADQLYTIPERDDRLIAGTAAHLGYPLITRDPEISTVADIAAIR